MPQGPHAVPVLLRGVDRAALATSLGVRLRRAGVDVGLTAVETFSRALEVCPPDRRADLYWAARLTLVRQREQIEIFDQVFQAVFADAVLDPRARPVNHGTAPPAAVSDDEQMLQLPTLRGESEEGRGLPWLRLPAVVGTDDDPEDPGAVELPERLPSLLEGAADKPFADLDAAELVLLDDWLRAALVAWPVRPSRRLTPSRSGRHISLRRTMAGARRTGFEAIELHRIRPVRKPRRLLMVCDVSQSMQPYAAAYLHLMRAAAMVTRSEVFAFSTTLTRLTSVLRHKSPEKAIELASDRVTDRFGGTRIAGNLRTLLASHHGDGVRGAVVLIASDGWDTDDPAELGRLMARLRRRAHRVIWLNPRAASPGYAPLVGAMAAALPHCDAMLPAHTVRQLAAVLDAITHDSGRRGSVGSVVAARSAGLSSRA